MSLKDAAAAAFAVGRATLGEQRVFSIAGGPALEVIENGSRIDRGYDELIHSPEESLNVMTTRAAFEAAYPEDRATYLGELATLGDENWRVGALEPYGRHYVVAALVSREEAA